MHRMWFQTFLHATPPAGGGGAGDPPPPPEPHRSGFDMDRAARNAVTEFRGNVRAMAKHFIAEGRRYRDRIRVLDESLRKRPEIEEGGALLTKDENTRWQKLKGLAADVVDKVADRLKKADELETADAQRQRAERIKQAGAALDIKRPGLLADQMAQRGHEVVEKEETVVDAAGKREAKKVYHVQKVGAAATEPTTPLQEWVNKELADYKELLMTEPTDATEPPPREPTGDYPAQRGVRGRAPKNDLVTQHGSRYMSPSELRQQANKGA